jgi:hypothetical protein
VREREREIVREGERESLDEMRTIMLNVMLLPYVIVLESEKGKIKLRKGTAEQILTDRQIDKVKQGSGKKGDNSYTYSSMSIVIGLWT